MQNWVEQKKAEAAGGAGGAVVGGMLGGPLGAFVGAQVGTRIMPSLSNAMKQLEGEESDKLEADAPGGPQKGEAKKEAAASTEQPRPQEAAAAPEAAAAAAPPAASPQAPASLEAQAGALRRSSPEGGRSRMAAAPSQEDALASELSTLRQGAARRRQQLEAEVDELYAKAEKALAAGDEAGARALLACRAASMAKLEDLSKGQRKRAQEEHDRLSAEVQKLYAGAEQAIAAGDEDRARALLEKWQQAKAALEISETELSGLQ